MCRLAVLGFETRQDKFEYVYDDADFERVSKLAEVYAGNVPIQRTESIRRYVRTWASLSS